MLNSVNLHTENITIHFFLLFFYEYLMLKLNRDKNWYFGTVIVYASYISYRI